MKERNIQRKEVLYTHKTYHRYHGHFGIIIPSDVNATAPGNDQLVIGADQCWNEFRALEELRIQTTDDYAVVAGGMRHHAF
jgi:hypothetical protein